jgi:hypothetical protein
MNIDDLTALAQRIHDAEGMDFGRNSTREQRNAQWARIVGIVHHGHPTWNPAPDPRWHIKRASEGRPQSDDVVVLLPSRAYWDIIGSAGADGYSFRVGAHPEPLEASQIVYAPPVPSGSVPMPNPGTPPPNPGTPAPAPVACTCKADLERVTSALVALTNTVASQASVLAGLSERLDEEWAARVWTGTDPERVPPAPPVPEFPAYQGSVLGARITLRPVK